MNRSLLLVAFLALCSVVPQGCDAPAVSEPSHVLYTCPMHPNIRQDHPGKCPICHMALVPLDDAMRHDNGDVTVHAEGRRLAGVRLVEARRADLASEVRAPGRVVLDQTRVFDVTLRVGGYVSRLFADAEGAVVAAGAPVLWLESPELVAAQNELLRANRASAQPGGDDLLVQAATQRLRVWGLSDAQLDEIKSSGRILDPVPIVSAQSGVVVEKDVVVGQRVEAGQRVARLARLDKVWIEAEVFPDDARALAVGQEARVRVLGDAAAPLMGKVSRVLPSADKGARTVKVRIDVDNAASGGQRALVTGAAVVAEILAAKREALVVPRDAVIRTGERDVVFVQSTAPGGEDVLQLRAVEVGAHDADNVEIIKGLAAGERVVSRAAFLVAAESRLRVPAQWDSAGSTP